MLAADSIADFIARTLAGYGVRCVFGVGGANIEDLFAAVQRLRPGMRAVLGKHEHAAGAAADAYARLTGELGVVMATSGGGAMNLVPSLAEALASSVPLLAIVGEPPTDVQGKGAFQDTSGKGGALDAAQVFRAVSVFCARVEAPGDVAGLLEAARAAACGPTPGPAVLLIAKDRQRAAIGPVAAAGNRWAGDGAEGAPRVSADVGTKSLHAGGTESSHAVGTKFPQDAGTVLPHPAHVVGTRLPPAGGTMFAQAARTLGLRPAVLIAGDEVARAGAAADLARLANALDARVAVAPDARDVFDNRDPRFLGVAGAMGHAPVARALAEARVCAVIGTRLPLLARQGLEAILREKSFVSMGRDEPFPASKQSLHLPGDLRSNLRTLIALLGDRPSAVPDPVPPPSASNDEEFSSSRVLAAIDRALPEGGVALIDAGNTGAQAIHHLRAAKGGRWLVAMGMAGMGWTFGAAIGAALATGRRCTVLAGDGAFFMHGLDVHTALEHDLPITYILFNNRAHGMCLVRERLLLGGESGYNSFRVSHLGAGMAAMFPGLAARDCASIAEIEEALARADAGRGPAVIGVELPMVEVPPFVAFQQALAAAPTQAAIPPAGHP